VPSCIDSVSADLRLDLYNRMRRTVDNDTPQFLEYIIKEIVAPGEPTEAGVP